MDETTSLNPLLKLTPLGFALFIVLFSLVAGIGVGVLMSFQYLNQRISMLDGRQNTPVVCQVVLKPEVTPIVPISIHTTVVPVK